MDDSEGDESGEDDEPDQDGEYDPAYLDELRAPERPTLTPQNPWAAGNWEEKDINPHPIVRKRFVSEQSAPYLPPKSDFKGSGPRNIPIIPNMSVADYMELYYDDGIL